MDLVDIAVTLPTSLRVVRVCQHDPDIYTLGVIIHLGYEPVVIAFDVKDRAVTNGIGMGQVLSCFRQAAPSCAPS